MKRTTERWAYSFGHTDTGISKSQGLILLIWDDVDTEIFARVQLAWIWKSLITDLVQGIRAIWNQLSQEDFLVRVDGVDNEREELWDFGWLTKSGQPMFTVGEEWVLPWKVNCSVAIFAIWSQNLIVRVIE